MKKWIWIGSAGVVCMGLSALLLHIFFHKVNDSRENDRAHTTESHRNAMPRRAADPNLPSGDEVFQIYLQKIGGTEALEGVRNLKFAGVFEMQDEVYDLTVFVCGNRTSLWRAEAGDVRMEGGFDGEVAWITRGGYSEPDVSSTLNENRWASDPRSAVHYAEYLRDLRTLEMTRFHGKRVYKVSAVTDDDIEVFMYFDVESGLYAGREFTRQKSDMKTERTVETVDEYEAKAGILFNMISEETVTITETSPAVGRRMQQWTPASEDAYRSKFEVDEVWVNHDACPDIIAPASVKQQLSPHRVSGMVQLDAVPASGVSVLLETTVGAERLRQSAQTDRTGAFVFENVKGAQYMLVAWTEFSERRIYGALPPGTDVDGLTISLITSAGVRGKVTDEDGQPLGEVPVSYAVQSDKEGRYEYLCVEGGGYAARSGIEEDAAVKDTPPQKNNCVVRVKHDGYQTYCRAFTVPKGIWKSHDIVLQKEMSVRGRVVDAKGNPLENVSLRAMQIHPHASVKSPQHPCFEPDASMGVSSFAVTEADGTFAFRNLSFGEYKVVAVHPGAPEAMLVNGPTENMEIVFTEQGAVFGKVIDTEGNPLTMTAVFVERELSSEDDNDRPGGESAYLSAATDAQGRYRLGPLAEGNYALTVSGESAARKSFTLRSGEALALDVIIPRHASYLAISGTVVNGSGEPMGNVSVTAEPKLTKDSWKMRYPGYAYSADDGTFSVSNLMPGEYELNAVQTPGMPIEGRGGTVAVAGARDVVLMIPNRTTVVGRVLDVTGHPISTFSLLSPVSSYFSDAGGMFSVQVEEDADELVVTSYGYLQTAVLIPAGAQGEVVNLGDVVLEKAYDVHGTVISYPTGEPLAEAMVFTPTRWASTDENGRFTLTGITSDEVELKVQANGYAMVEETVSVEEDVEILVGEGSIVRVDVFDRIGEVVNNVSICFWCEDSPTFCLPPGQNEQQGVMAGRCEISALDYRGDGGAARVFETLSVDIAQDETVSFELQEMGNGAYVIIDLRDPQGDPVQVISLLAAGDVSPPRTQADVALLQLSKRTYWPMGSMSDGRLSFSVPPGKYTFIAYRSMNRAQMMVYTKPLTIEEGGRSELEMTMQSDEVTFISISMDE